MSIDHIEIERQSTGDQVATALRELIFGGEFAPGAPLQDVPMARAMGVARATFREAIQTLVHEGIVEHRRHRGARVRRLTAGDVHDLYRVRTIIETAAIDAIPAMDLAIPEKELTALEDAVRAIEGGTRTEDSATVADADLAFHRRLVGLAGSDRLLAAFEQLSGETRLCMSVVDRHYEAPEVLAREHREMLRALQRNDRATCRSLLKQHLENGDLRISKVQEKLDNAYDSAEATQ